MLFFSSQKIISKELASRWEKIIPSIILNDQTEFIKGQHDQKHWKTTKSD